MILVEAGQQTDRSFDGKLLFAAQLAERGHPVILDEASLPDPLDRTPRYEAAPFLADPEEVGITRVLVIGAEDLGTQTLGRLRALDLPAGVPVVAIGTFPDRQSMIGARTRLAYALGREPGIVDLAATLGTPLSVAGVAPLAAPVRRLPVQTGGPAELFLFLPADRFEDSQTLPWLAALDNVPDYRLSIVTPGHGKERLKRTRYAALNVFGYSELGPAALARRAHIAAFFGDAIPGERMAAFALDLLASGKAVLDCTAGAAFQATGAPVVRGPEELAALPGFLEVTVTPNLAGIGRAARENRWTTGRSVERLEAAAGLVPPARSAPAAAEPGRIVFWPTNGNGLGHAQRCLLIAEALDRPETALFTAFPSCVSLIRGRGFPCLPLVQKSPDHPEEYANDLVNYVRLGRTLRPADHLVFDGGYVFDSVYRAVQETGCSATWIRRGLWRPGQVADAPLERERAFRSVVVPEEAFPELNVDYSRGDHVRRVGPIVQAAPGIDRADLRDRLARTVGVDFDTLVVTMLGGGVASDRTAQVQALAGLLEDRPRCLHLVVVWPHSRVAPGLSGWRRTRLVRTRASLVLAAAADLAVSAVGYNTFHELLYAGVPTVFIPQVAAYLDDQERRARAASDRGLAETVRPHEMLLLERRIADLLDGGGAAALRDRLAALTLPERGNLAAARLLAAEAGR